jgi:tetratricopeptide (TPR) repeat protein
MSAEASQSLPVSYEGAIQRAALGAANWLKRLEDESHHARDLLAELLRDPGPEPLDRLRQASPALSLKLLRLLQDRCQSLWFKEPARAVELAELEMAVINQLDEARCGSALAADSQALAWADLGNSYRILGDFQRAEMALRKAAEHQRLSGDLLTEAKILAFTASLRKQQGRYSESFANYDRVIEIARLGEDRYVEGQALIAKGNALGEQALAGMGDFHRSIRLLRKGMVRIGSTSEPGLMFMAQHNLANQLNAAGRSQEASQALEQNRHLYKDIGEEPSFAKLHWLEGSIAESVDRIQDAEISFRKARELLSHLQLAPGVASISLRLCLVLCRRGQRQEARQLMREVVPIFESLGTHAEESAAKLLSLRLRS